MLLLADRGFLGFELWRAAAATGADLLWRAKSNAVSASFEDGSYLSRIAAADDRKRTNPITVRVVEYSLGPRGKDNTVYRLVTTLLDPGAAPAAELAALYAERWEIESTLDEIKTQLGGPRPVLRSQHPQGAEQEIFAFLLVHHALRDLMRQSAHRAGRDPDRISFTRTLHVVRRQTTGQALPRPPESTTPLNREDPRMRRRTIPPSGQRTVPVSQGGSREHLWPLTCHQRDIG
ncbi:transposase [Streptomyces avermitilis]|uniref:transposase n=1 Tax=Streptomyces avermitilis TaxID=33903 RepID=UPI0033B81CF5